jgi:alkanesulfonate monooxygenase SsuD/methylene tetrahydromethanopterin reductase-like flavin-dependent oxidoreductase (luciferase family)
VLSTPDSPPTTRPLRFGVFLAPDAARAAETLALAETAERVGLDLIGVQDHPYQPAHLDVMALLGHLLARTSTIRVFPDVANLLLRPPAMLAKAAATLDVLSRGRFELGLGAGGFPDRAVGMGAPARTLGSRVSSVEEAIGVLRRAWAADAPIRHHGKQYDLPGYTPGPPPAHPIGIWLGAYRRRMLELTGRHADGWVPSQPYLPPCAVPDALATIEAAARAAGREPDAIRRIYNVVGIVRPSGPARGLLDGPPAHWVEVLSEWAVTLGFDTFVLGAAGDARDQVTRFGRDVAPEVRARVESSRSGPRHPQPEGRS